MDGKDFESLTYIRRKLRRWEISVPDSRLERWREWGLLPRPTRQAMGRAKGTVSLYPVGTARRIRDLQWAFDQHRSRWFAGWSLWAKGYDVTQFFRAQIERWLKETEAFLAEYEASLEAGGNAPFTAAETRFLRNNLGRANVSPAQDFIFDFLNGQFTGTPLGTREDVEFYSRWALHKDGQKHLRSVLKGQKRDKDVKAFFGWLKERSLAVNVTAVRRLLADVTPDMLRCMQMEVIAFSDAVKRSQDFTFSPALIGALMPIWFAVRWGPDRAEIDAFFADPTWHTRPPETILQILKDVWALANDPSTKLLPSSGTGSPSPSNEDISS